jgi:protein SCO1/2
MWWFMALVELPPATPDWVLRARVICFGNGGNGLPDTSGWLLLTVSPLSFLGALFAIWGRELRLDVKKRWSGPGSRWGLLGLIALVALGALWSAARVSDGLARGAAWRLDSTEPLPEDYPRLNRPAPAFALTDQHGTRRALADLRGEVVLLTFAFAHCNTVCPVTVRAVLDGAKGVAAPHRVLVVTLDPWRDTARSLPAIAGQWGLGERDLALSDEVAQVSEVLDRYGIPRERDLNTGDITHPPLVYVIDPEGRIAYALNRPSAEWVREAGRRAAVAQGSEGR